MIHSFTETLALHILFSSHPSLLPKQDRSRNIINTIHDSQRLQLNSLGADNLASLLETFFDGDTDTLDGSVGFLHQLNQSLQSTTISQKIIDNQYMILRSYIFLGNDHIVNLFMSEGLDFGFVNIPAKSLLSSFSK